MLDLQYWAGLALKVGQDKPELKASLQETKSQVMAAEAKILKFRRKLTLMLTDEDVDPDKLLTYEERMSDLTNSMINYRREMIQKSLDYVTDYYQSTNRHLTEEDSKLDIKLLKRLVLLARDALKRIGTSLEANEVDVRLFLNLKQQMQEYLSLIIKQIAKAGVTAQDLESRHLQPCSN